MNPGIMFDLERYHPRTFKRFVEHKNNYLYQTIKINLERGVAEGLYRPEMNIEIVAQFRLESMMVAFNPGVFRDTNFSLVQLHHEVMMQFLFGSATLKGHKLITKYIEERTKKETNYEALSATKNK